MDSHLFAQALLSVFDFQELELLLCGLPEIDIDDWKRNTEFELRGYARLLLFASGL